MTTDKTDKIYDDAGVIRAEYYNWKPRLGAKRLQLIMEVPLEHQERVLKILGAPSADSAKWVVIGLLKDLVTTQDDQANVVPLKDPVRAERFRNASPADQAKGLAHMWAADPEFWEWCDAVDEAGAMEFIHMTCGVKSCKEFSREEETLKRFDRLIAVPYQQEIGRLAEARR